MSRSNAFHRLQRLFGIARDRAGLAPPAGPSRREVLHGLTAALVTSAVPAAGCRSRVFTVAVVGGGLAGTHAALRLQQAGVDVALYEANARLGGRTFTAHGEFSNGHLCELGGELIDSNHATMWALADELGLTLDDRRAAPFDALAPDSYRVNDAPVGDELLLEQLVAVVAAIQEDYDAAESDDEAYAYLDLESLADWLERRVPAATSPELHAVLATAYRGEFGLEIDQQSALNLVYLVGLDTDAFRIFGESDERWHTHEGNDAFVAAMGEQLPGGVVHLGHKLVRAEGAGPFTLVFDTDGGEVTVEADHVVFALPFTMLKGVDTARLELSAGKRAIIGDLGYGTNAKVMGEFSRPVWREDHGAMGGITTDLPVQQTWDTSIGQDGPGAILTNFLGGAQGVASGAGEADAWFTSVVLPDLETIYPGAAAAYVSGSAVRMHWPTVPTMMGSYACYRPGQWATWGVEGEREGDLHFCGEHASADFQGWMEGAAESGLRVATEIIDDHGLEVPEAARRLVELRRAIPPGDRRNALRAMRLRRPYLAAMAWKIRNPG